MLDNLGCQVGWSLRQLLSTGLKATESSCSQPSRQQQKMQARAIRSASWTRTCWVAAVRIADTEAQAQQMCRLHASKAVRFTQAFCRRCGKRAQARLACLFTPASWPLSSRHLMISLLTWIAHATHEVQILNAWQAGMTGAIASRGCLRP